MALPTRVWSKAMMIEMLYETPVERFLEAMAAGLDGPAAEGKNLKVNLVLTDLRGKLCAVDRERSTALQARRTGP